jgi:putative CocE/NonD family hydrolase
MLRTALAGALITACAPAAAAHAWTPEPATYGEGVTHDVKVTMRDGVQLDADVYYPTTSGGAEAKGPFPVLLSETPYGKEAGSVDSLDILAGHRPNLVKRGYIQAIVDVRGQGGSQGSFQLLGPDEAADSKEVVTWASKLPNSTGKVGMTGESYLGIVQMFAAAAVGKNSPLKAIFPIVTANDPYKDLLVSGGLLNIESSAPLVAAYGVLPLASPLFQAGFDPQTAATYGKLFPARVTDLANGFAAPTTANILAGGDRAYEGQYWGDHRRPADVLAQIVANGIPAYLVGGLYDVFQRGEPLNYAGLQNASVGRPTYAPMSPTQRVTGRYQLLMKPQYHTTVDAGAPNLDMLQLAWFDRWLKGEATGIDKTTTPLHFVEPGGVEREAKRFPLDQAPEHVFYLGAGGALSPGKPVASGQDQLAFTGASLPCDRSTEQWSLGAFELALQPLGLGDPCAQRQIVPASAGPGQLVYTSGAMPADAVLAGPLAATIYATANTTDTEWIAKVSDVAPDGTETDLTQGALEGSHRALDEARTWRAADGLPILPYHTDTKATKAPVVPGQLTRYDIEIRSMFATVKAGHRIRLTLLSSQSPHLIPIPEDLPHLAGGEYFVHRGAGAASSLQVPLATPASFAQPAAAACAGPHGYVVRRTLKLRRGRLSMTGHTYVPCRARPAKRVSVAIARRVGRRCAFLTAKHRFGRPRSCLSPVRLIATGTRTWRFAARARFTRGRYVLYVQAVDTHGRREPQPRPNATFRVRR